MFDKMKYFGQNIITMPKYIKQLDNIYTTVSSWHLAKHLQPKNQRREAKRKKLKFVIWTLEAAAVGIILYLVILPFYPTIKYQVGADVTLPENQNKEIFETINTLPESEAIALTREQVAVMKAKLEEKVKASAPETTPENIAAAPAASAPAPAPAQPKQPQNRVIIPKIGVNAPIVISDSAEYGLDHGAWLVPDTSTPDQGGNTVLTGHRFKYLPPNNLTFYLFHKLEAGDMVNVTWQEKDYLYRIVETKIVEPNDLSILADTEKPTLTMYTCNPIYSTEERLVVVAELVEGDS